MSESLSCEVAVVGAGVGGICAALAAARSGARTLLIERAPGLGGTGVHAPVGLVCQFFARDGRPVNTGIHRELFPEAYAWNGRFDDQDPVPVYDEALLAGRYRALCAAEPYLAVRCGAGVVAVERAGRRLVGATLADGTTVSAAIWIDATADGHLADLAGCAWDKGRADDGAMMTATLTFKLAGIDRTRLARPDILTWGGIRSLRRELDPLYQAAKAAGRTDNLRHGVLCFPYPDGDALLFNSTAVAGIDPTVAGSVEAGRIAAERQARELVAAVQQHPALAGSRLAFLAPWLGVREGRRIRGEHLLTGAELLGEARFPDMVAACAYGPDIHDPKGGKAILQEIPGSGYAHIPWRSLVARDLDNLALGSRCISGDHVAHSAYRVMSVVSAIGQAAGTGAALAAQSGVGALRTLDAARIRASLAATGQFVES
jgi:hypothetical protein